MKFYTFYLAVLMEGGQRAHSICCVECQRTIVVQFSALDTLFSKSCSQLELGLQLRFKPFSQKCTKTHQYSFYFNTNTRTHIVITPKASRVILAHFHFCFAKIWTQFDTKVQNITNSGLTHLHLTSSFMSYYETLMSTCSTNPYTPS